MEQSGAQWEQPARPIVTDKDWKAHLGQKPTSSESEADESTTTDDSRDNSSSDEGEREHLRTRREQATIARKFTLEIEQQAYKQQEIQWAEEQETYTPHDERLGAGEAALWNSLHRPIEGKITRDRWGILHLIDHRTANPEHVATYIEMLAGCTPTLKSFQCKRRTTKEWKYPKSYTDEQRREATRCPCGGGIQDGVHILRCQNARIRTLKNAVLIEANDLMERLETKLRTALLAENDHGPNTKEARRLADKRESLTNLQNWRLQKDIDKLRDTMGGTPTTLDQATRGQLITTCLAEWGEIEDAWDEVNQES